MKRPSGSESRRWVFVPGHISGFFQPFFHPSPARAGSRNFGPCTSVGVWTGVRKGKGVRILVNGREFQPEPTLRILKKLGVTGVRIEHLCEVPPGTGFGVSAGWALGTALAVSRAFGPALPKGRLVSLAHEAEVESGTGLGDVGAQNKGGVVLGLEPGAPPYGKWRRLPVRGFRLLCAVLGALSTKGLLGEEEFRRKASRLGGEAVRAVMARPSLKTAMESSLRFAEGLGLLDSELRELIHLCQREGVMASQIMLGRGIFSFVRPEKVEKVRRVLGGVVGEDRVLVCGIGGPARFTGAPRGRVFPAVSFQGP
ncbi:MAG: pantoate kinase [Candidatus Hadarchaeales archaeon]